MKMLYHSLDTGMLVAKKSNKNLMNRGAEKNFSLTYRNVNVLDVTPKTEDAGKFLLAYFTSVDEL